MKKIDKSTMIKALQRVLTNYKDALQTQPKLLEEIESLVTNTEAKAKALSDAFLNAKILLRLPSDFIKTITAETSETPETSTETTETTETTAETVETKKPKTRKPRKPKKVEETVTTTDTEAEVNAETETTIDIPESSTPHADFFPTTFENASLGKLVSVANLFHDFTSLKKVILSGKYSVYFCCHWTPQLLVQCNYAATHGLPKKYVPTAFDKDLDIMQAMVMCDKSKRIYCQSAYTDAVLYFNAKELKPVETENIQIRISSGLEFELYMPVADYIAYTANNK